MRVQCCVCHRIRVKGRWAAPRDAVDGEVSHTYCPACMTELMASLRAKAMAGKRAAPLAV